MKTFATFETPDSTSITQLVGVISFTSVIHYAGENMFTVLTQSVSETPTTSVTQSPVKATLQLAPIKSLQCICFETITSLIIPSGVLDSEEIKSIKARAAPTEILL